MRVHGLELVQGDTAFAFCVLRLRQATAHTALLDLVRLMGPLIPDADTVIEDLLPEDLEQAVHIIAVPWQPPTTPAELASQHALLRSAEVEEAWFFQTGTSLPPVDDDDEDTDPVWSHGPPPTITRTRFPVDGTDDADTEDFGIAIKLAGDILPGEGTVLLAFHTLWLAPYGGRYRNSSVTIDRTRHAAHLWVDRFEVLADANELVGHLLWIISKLDEVIPIVHARFASATMAQKYGELLGDDEDEEPFVLGGNPLMAQYALGGEAAVDAWIEKQTAWSNEEVAHMLREVAVEIVTADEPDDDLDATDSDDLDADSAATASDDRERAVTLYAADILRARAKRGRLDRRAITPLIDTLSSSTEDRRLDAISILGAAKARAAVPPLVEMLRRDPHLAGSVSSALGEIGDPAAAAALAEVVVTQVETTAPPLLAIGALARALPTADQARVREHLTALDVADPTVLLAREAALVMLGATPSRDLAVVLHECLTDDTDVRTALRVAELVPNIVDAADLASLTTSVDDDIRRAAHALLATRGEALPEAPRFDRYVVRDLTDDALIQHIGASRVIGRAALIAEAARRHLTRAIPAITDACHDVVSRAPFDEADARVLEEAVPFLRRHVDEHVISLFERMLRKDATNDDDQDMN